MQQIKTDYESKTVLCCKIDDSSSLANMAYTHGQRKNRKNNVRLYTVIPAGPLTLTYSCNK